MRDFFRDNYLDALRVKASMEFSPEGSITNCLLWLFKTYPINMFFTPLRQEKDTISREGSVASHKFKQQQKDYTISQVLYQFWSHVMQNESFIDDKTIESFFDAMVTLCGQNWATFILPPKLTRYFTPYPAKAMLNPWAAYLNLESYLRRNWKPGNVKGYFDHGTLALVIALEPRCILCLPKYSGNDSSFQILRDRLLDDVVSSDGSFPIPISAATIQTLLDVGAGPLDRKLGLAFLHRFQQWRAWDFKTMAELTRVVALADSVYLSNQHVLEVTKVLFKHGGLSVPMVPDEESGICKANFGTLFRPLFGVDGVAELSEIRRRLQEEVSWVNRLSRAFGGSGG
ncbi:hypothetical protein PGQ11_002625 [Apiospora arundinis]|uniref:Uncharacterized protein n=1 Tax=Apiospora arundinis TaxID=335852 RepID=A0ABR2JJ23_9PEZI